MAASEAVYDTLTLDIRGVERRFGYSSLWLPPEGQPCIKAIDDIGACDYLYRPSRKHHLKGKELRDSKPLHWCEIPVIQAENFARGIVLVDGDFDGEPFVPLDWVAVLIEVLFGVMMWDASARNPGFYRLIQEVVASITRGQMKSTFEEFLIAFFLAWWKPGSEGCFAQQSQEETMKKMQPKTQRMLENSPVCENLDWHWTGKSTLSGGSYRFSRGKGGGDVNMRLVTPENVKAAKGYRYSFGIFDEVGFMPSDTVEELVEEAVKKSCIVPDPIWIQTSTQSKDSGHYQRRKVSTALEVLKNPAFNPRLWPVLYISDATVNIHDRQVWLDLGPLFRLKKLPMSILEQEYAEALLDPRLMNIFARERCGYAGDYAMKLMPREAWMRCAVAGGRNEILERMKGLAIYAACDFSEMSDLSAFVLIAFEADGTMLVAAWHWIPDAKKEQLDALLQGQVAMWISDGWLETLPEGHEMPARVAERCLDIIEPVRDDVVAWGYDKWHADAAATIWRDAGWQDRTFIIAQGAGLNAPIKSASVIAENNLLAHPGDPVLDYCVLCAQKEADTKDPDKLRLVKSDRHDGPDRNDGATAWLTAWQTYLAAEYYRSKKPIKDDWSSVVPKVWSV